MELIRKEKVGKDEIQACIPIAKAFKMKDKELRRIIRNSCRNKHLIFIMDNGEIKGFADAYKYTDGHYNFLMVNYLAIKDIKLSDFLFDGLIGFGFLNFIFFKKAKANKYRLLEMDYKNRKLNYLKIKEMN